MRAALPEQPMSTVSSRAGRSCREALLLLAGLLASSAATANDAPLPVAPSAPSAQAAVPTFTLKLPMEQPVPFRGMVSYDDAGVQGGQMLYPAPNPGGLLVAILTHSLVVEAQKDSQRSALQQAADKVLDPYKDVLDGFAHAELLQRSIAKAALFGPHRHVQPADAEEGDWVVESAPVFTLAQDRSVLVLENAIAIRARGEPQKALYQTIVKVVSGPKAAIGTVDYWAAGGGTRFQEESALLFAHSLGVAFDHAGRQPSQPQATQKTYRYPEGGKERMERGSLIGEHCNRIVIRNLRGWLLSIPGRAGSAVDAGVADQCVDPLLPA